ncbi:OmpW/AlkL family protein [Xylophilus sp. GOD-11R]|uniref:OmpW/AlkL family protein n=1 Tax=Xylophilus sp. GOD-11R TaxID=3089814 RepID=UPI00298BF571|nr:OmpW family outer membrane protein [Xylophilus sp. GOD-11R]WPB58092.1 OmpW family outer membrane protein [Xylophilus sp. GOD-11R]
MNTKAFVIAAAVAATLSPIASHAQDTQEATGPWMVRVRAAYLNPANRDSTRLDLSINSKTIPEVDISYFFTPEWATELVLTVPQKQDIRAGGTDIGSLRHLPPTLTAQYHFTGFGAIKPYLGAGINYTRFSSVRFAPAVASALQPGIEKSSVGAALQVGLDYALTRNLVLNIDVKKLQIRTDVRSAGQRIGQLQVDPWLVGVGLGWRF